MRLFDVSIGADMNNEWNMPIWGGKIWKMNAYENRFDN